MPVPRSAAIGPAAVDVIEAPGEGEEVFAA